MSQPAEAVSGGITRLTHYINGEHVAGVSDRFGDVFNPSKGVKAAEVPLASKAEVEAAITVAENAFPEWAATPVQQRARIMARYVQLLYQHQHELATLVLEAWMLVEAVLLFPRARGVLEAGGEPIPEAV